MVWFALIIPLAAIIICYKGWSYKMAWWEYLLPLGISIITIFSMNACQQKIMVKDVEFWGNEIIEAHYYESWSTWVEKTCTVKCGEDCTTDSKGNKTCTNRYCEEDCSYCDEHPAIWEAVDLRGNIYPISHKYYNYLQRKWNASSLFVELNRTIDKDGSCGKDGDLYVIKWDGRIESSEAATTVHNYDNIVQASHSAFKLEKISDKQAEELNLFKYPEVEKPYKQKAILGIDSIYSPQASEEIQTYFEYFNGHFGPPNKVKLFVLVFYNKPLSIVNKQQAYWDGGNKNEFVVCLSINKQTKEVQWTKCFSWTDNKRAAIDVREDFMEYSDRTRRFNPRVLYDVIVKAIGDKDMHKSFRVDFSYLSIELPTSTIIWIFIITAVVTTLSCIFAIRNNIDNTNKQTKSYGNSNFRRWDRY